MSNPGGEPGWTLRQRLQLIITLALIPVVMVSLFQGVARARLDIANVHDRLIQSARTVAAGDQNLLAAAEQVLRAVGSLSEVRGMNGNCDGVLADTLIGVRYFSNLTRIDGRGQIARCSRSGVIEAVPAHVRHHRGLQDPWAVCLNGRR